jgi:hypothetical protein
LSPERGRGEKGEISHHPKNNNSKIIISKLKKGQGGKKKILKNYFKNGPETTGYVVGSVISNLLLL